MLLFRCRQWAAKPVESLSLLPDPAQRQSVPHGYLADVAPGAQYGLFAFTWPLEPEHGPSLHSNKLFCSSPYARRSRFSLNFPEWKLHFGFR